MKKVISFSFAVIMALSLFTSCGGGNKTTNDATSKEGESKESAVANNKEWKDVVVGQWVIQIDKSTIPAEELAQIPECAFESWMEIKADGTITNFEECEKKNETIPAGTWETKGEQHLFTIEENGQTLVFLFEVPTEDQLVMTIEMFGEKASQTFIRKK